MMATHVRVIEETFGLITGWLNRGWSGLDFGLWYCALDPAARAKRRRRVPRDGSDYRPRAHRFVDMEFHSTPAHAPLPFVHVRCKSRVNIQCAKMRSAGPRSRLWLSAKLWKGVRAWRANAGLTSGKVIPCTVQNQRRLLDQPCRLLERIACISRMSSAEFCAPNTHTPTSTDNAVRC
jgi:hypothetical protein